MTGPAPVVYFAHANGFPSGSYRRFLEPLRGQYRVVAPDRLGHQPGYPVDDNWEGLIDELLDGISATTAEPVVGLGHSLGGLLTFLAAVRQPRRFRAVVLMDPPVLHSWRSAIAWVAKRLGFIDRITPAGRSVGRRAHWPDTDTARSYFQARPLFANLDPGCLEDYLQAGLEPDPEGGVKLRFDPAVEVAIFRTIPDHLPRLPKPLACPAALVLGEDTSVTPQADFRNLTRAHRLGVSRVPGGHLFPLQHPESTAAHVSGVIGRLLAESEPHIVPREPKPGTRRRARRRR